MLRIWVKNPAVPVEIPPDTITVNYGLLYNRYAAEDIRLICADGWSIADGDEWATLATYLVSDEGNKLKEIGTTYWFSDSGALNSVGFNGRGAGIRGTYGGFDNTNIQYVCAFHDSTLPGYSRSLEHNATSLGSNTGMSVNNGLSIRPFRLATESEELLADGTECAPYPLNSGGYQRTVKIGTQVWLADNLCEKKFRNGDYIHGYELGVYAPIPDEDWAALTTDGVCCYNDDTDNI